MTHRLSPLPTTRTSMWFRFVLVGFCLFFCYPGGLAQSRPNCHGPEPLEAATRSQPTARNWAALGGWFGEHRQFACAIPAFREALRVDPGSASLHYYLGLALLSSGKSGEALAELKRSIELDPNQFQPRLLAGEILNESGQRGEAEAFWEAALRIDPASTIALDWLAKARIADGQFEAAIDLLLSAPRDEELTIDLALAYSRAGFFDKAAETLNAALERAPGDLHLTSALATVYVQSHRYQDATNKLQAALQLHPHDPATELLYLELLVMQGDDATARPLAHRMMAANPNSFDALYLSGILESDAQEYASAIKHLKAAVAMNPNHYNARYNLGLAYSRLQQNEAAGEQFEKAVALDPTQAEAHFYLAQVLRSLGRTDRAQEQLKLFQECQQATVKLALGQTKAGQAAQALRDGHADQAVALYREAVEAQPKDANFEYDLAIALEAIGDPVQERAALEKAIALRPGFAAAENQLGLIEARSGDTVAAEQHFRSSLATVPHFAEALNNFGTLLGQEARDTEAEALFRLAVSANPRYTQAWVNLAATLASQSRFSEAQDAVENALKTAPQDPDALRLQQMLAKAAGSSSPSPHASHGHSSSQVPH
jgi:tetratricopeptide (TPR) repeat protein